MNYRNVCRMIGVIDWWLRGELYRRLQRAVELVRGGRSGLAKIAARTGFADQSHLSRWVRRVYGASPGKIGN
ncbi:helix-turn-helix domain-containing protein [Bradyrhizobium sp. LB13.1]